MDNLVLLDQATNVDGSYNVTALVNNPNFHIYFAQATINGVSVAEKLNRKNNGMFRWVPTYAGYYSSTNLVYPPGVTNTVNAALAQSQDIDSNGDGIPNGSDPTPFLESAQINFTSTVTNVSFLRLQWVTVAGGTNQIQYTTNFPPSNWQVLTGFGNYYYGANVAVPVPANATSFVSPFPYPSAPGPVWVLEPMTNPTRYYRVMVQEDLLRGMPNP